MLQKIVCNVCVCVLFQEQNVETHISDLSGMLYLLKRGFKYQINQMNAEHYSLNLSLSVFSLIHMQSRTLTHSHRHAITCMPPYLHTLTFLMAV